MILQEGNLERALVVLADELRLKHRYLLVLHLRRRLQRRDRAGERGAFHARLLERKTVSHRRGRGPR